MSANNRSSKFIKNICRKKISDFSRILKKSDLKSCLKSILPISSSLLLILPIYFCFCSCIICNFWLKQDRRYSQLLKDNRSLLTKIHQTIRQKIICQKISREKKSSKRIRRKICQKSGQKNLSKKSSKKSVKKICQKYSSKKFVKKLVKKIHQKIL